MDLSVTPREQAFKEEFCAWLGENLPPDWKRSRARTLDEDEQWSISKRWGRHLGSAGYLGIGWPRLYGGRDATYMERALYFRELALHGAPPLPDPCGLSLIGPT